MDHNPIESRVNSYKSLNFGGTVEWAIDLDQFYSPVHPSQVLLASGCPATPGHGQLSSKSTCQNLIGEFPSSQYSLLH